MITVESLPPVEISYNLTGLSEKQLQVIEAALYASGKTDYNEGLAFWQTIKSALENADIAIDREVDLG